jgi:hypothetical protein
MKTPKLRIDQEFASLLEPHSPEELEQLEELLIADGCRDAIVVWRGTNIIVEGMTRYAICRKHGIRFKVVYRAFRSREEAIRFIHDNQLGRRNISAEAKHRLREERIKRVVEAHIINGQSKRSVAAQEGVSESQIRRDLAEANSGAPYGAPDLKNSGENNTLANKVEGKDGKLYPAARPKLLPEILELNLSPRLISDIEQWPHGKQKDFLSHFKAERDARKAYHAVLGQREPGDEDAPKKNGAVVFDWKKIEMHYGPLIRAIDDLKRAYPVQVDPSKCDLMREHLGEFLTVWTEEGKRLTKSKV